MTQFDRLLKVCSAVQHRVGSALTNCAAGLSWETCVIVADGVARGLPAPSSSVGVEDEQGSRRSSVSNLELLSQRVLMTTPNECGRLFAGGRPLRANPVQGLRGWGTGLADTLHLSTHLKSTLNCLFTGIPFTRASEEEVEVVEAPAHAARPSHYQTES